MSRSSSAMGISGRIAALFLQAQITPLLALLAFLLGLEVGGQLHQDVACLLQLLVGVALALA